MKLSRCTPQGPSLNKIHEIQANQIPETDQLQGERQLLNLTAAERQAWQNLAYLFLGAFSFFNFLHMLDKSDLHFLLLQGKTGLGKEQSFQ